VDKVAEVLVTNRSALEAKYGDRFDKVWQAIEALAKADEKRGLSTRIVAIDDAATMKELGGQAVQDADDPAAAKAAVDAVFAADTPDYVAIVGSVDVVPHQNLANPLARDGDPTAFGDLPYACEAPYGTDISKFLGPTRVVGRLPDVTGASDPKPFLRALRTATHWKAATRDDYAAYLGVTARVWEGSTTLSLSNAFGNATDLQRAPTEGPNWDDALLKRRSHFFNCHGAPANPSFWGQHDSKSPVNVVAHSASFVAGKLEEGTLLSAECCYGAELYDPVLAGGQAGMCNTYLDGGAYGVFGSSTIAYGPLSGNGQADVICQAFLKRVLEGASLGRATLEARQDFIAATPTLGPSDLKTLAQFSLMAHPSIVPVAPPPTEAAAPKGIAVGFVDEDAARAERRRNLTANGLALEGATSFAAQPAQERSAEMKTAIDDLQKELGLTDAPVESFAVEPPRILMKGAVVDVAEPQAFHVLFDQPHTETEAGVVALRLIVAKEHAGRVVAVEELHAK
jgi:hypothetical protein